MSKRNADTYIHYSIIVLCLISCGTLIYSKRLLSDAKYSYQQALAKEQQIKDALDQITQENASIENAILELEASLPFKKDTP